MAAYRKPNFVGERAQIRADQALLLADGDATCWISVQEYQCLNVDLYPADLQTTVVQNTARDKFPIPNCEPTLPTTCDAIVPADVKTVGMDACIILEMKHGGEKDIEAKPVKVWDNDGSVMMDADGNPQFICETFEKKKRLVRLRAARLGTSTFAGLKVVRGSDTQ